MLLYHFNVSKQKILILDREHLIGISIDRAVCESYFHERSATFLLPTQ